MLWINLFVFFWPLKHLIKYVIVFHTSYISENNLEKIMSFEISILAIKSDGLAQFWWPSGLERMSMIAVV